MIRVRVTQAGMTTRMIRVMIIGGQCTNLNIIESESSDQPGNRAGIESTGILVDSKSRRRFISKVGMHNLHKFWRLA